MPLHAGGARHVAHGDHGVPVAVVRQVPDRQGPAGVGAGRGGERRDVLGTLALGQGRQVPRRSAGRACGPGVPGPRRWPSAGRAWLAGASSRYSLRSSATQRRCPARSPARHSGHGVGAAQPSSVNMGGQVHRPPSRRRGKRPARGQVPTPVMDCPHESVRPTVPLPAAAGSGVRARLSPACQSHRPSATPSAAADFRPRSPLVRAQSSTGHGRARLRRRARKTR